MAWSRCSKWHQAHAPCCILPPLLLSISISSAVAKMTPAAPGQHWSQLSSLGGEKAPFSSNSSKAWGWLSLGTQESHPDAQVISASRGENILSSQGWALGLAYLAGVDVDWMWQRTHVPRNRRAFLPKYEEMTLGTQKQMATTRKQKCKTISTLIY